VTKDDKPGTRGEGIPDPDAPASAGEETRAEGFGDLVDKLVEGAPLPPAMDSDDRALIEIATMVVAGTHEIELQPERRSSIIDAALERAVLGPADAADAVDAADETAGPKKPGDKAPAAKEAPATAEDTELDDLAARRESRIARALPWVVATVAAAAAVILFVTRPPDGGIAEPTRPETPQIELSTMHRSRTADALVGQIPKSQSGHASARLDTIYSDRMAGYRDLSFRRRLGGGKL
jgi:hypothetical protein